MRSSPSTDLVFFTICARNYYPLARTFAQSVRRHHPDAALVLCVPDELGDTPPTADFDVVMTAASLDLPRFDHLAFRYTLLELSTAIKPAVFELLFASGYRHVVYCDPDIQLYAPMREVLDALRGGATTVLTPHGLSPNESPEPPNDRTFLQNGAYNLGFVALSDAPPVRRLLSWWGRQLETTCLANRLDAGLFVDQKWMDLWPAYCPDVCILRHPGYNVAYWNLDTRALARTAQGWTVDGEPLVFFHFSGIVPGDRRVLSKHQARWQPGSLPALQALTHDYHDALERNRNPEGMPDDYLYGRFRDGSPVPMIARWLFRDRLEPFDGDPFERMPAVLIEPAPEVSPNPHGIITRLMHHLWDVRDDLRRAFTLTSAASQGQYARWFVEIGWRQADVPAPLVDPVRARLDAVERHTPATAGWRSRMVRGAARRLGRYVFRPAPHLRPLYRFIRPEHRRRLALATFVRLGWPEGDPGGEIRHVVDAPSGVTPPLDEGLAIVGYPFAEIGVGEAMRALARSAAAAHVPFDVYNFDVHVRARQDDRSLAGAVTNRMTRAVNVFCVNTDMADETLRMLGAAALRGRVNVIRPFWELATAPPAWVDTLRRFDEIWAPTTFVRDAFAPLVDRPVVHMPVAVSVTSPGPDRRRFDLPDDAFVFLNMFDLASYPSRKNPDGVIRAFQTAFGATASAHDPLLVIKIMGNGPDSGAARDRLARQAGRDARIRIIDRTLDRSEVTSLIDSTDALVSLHRSEGFGFGVAEAMALGKPVIATDYSGTRDFVNADTGFPVAFDLVSVRPGEYPYYVEGQVWAEPDVAHAADHMRFVVDDPASAAIVAQQGRTFIETHHGVAAVGERLRAHLTAGGYLATQPG